MVIGIGARGTRPVGANFLLTVGKLGGLVALGTVGYMVIEKMALLDALYMTVITLSTVGYGEVHPLTPEGRIFTVLLILGAAGVALYLLAQMAQTLVETNLHEFLARRGMQRQIDQLHDHVIVCGFGRFGRIVAEELRTNDVPVVIVEANPAREVELERHGAPYLIGSAARDEVLHDAGVERARAILIGTGSDPDNVFITLSARQLNPKIRIHTRAETEEAIKRLELAGADQVVSAYHLGGQRMVSSILRPAVVDFLEIARPRVGDEVDLEEVRVAEGSALAGQSVEAIERDSKRLRIVGLKHGGDERIELAPDVRHDVCGGDHLVVIGERASLEVLARRATAGPDSGA